MIAYDRPIEGADYYISFDNFHVGELEGQMIVDGLKAEDKDRGDGEGRLRRRRSDRRQCEAVPRRRRQGHVRGGHQAGLPDTGHLGREARFRPTSSRPTPR